MISSNAFCVLKVYVIVFSSLEYCGHVYFLVFNVVEYAVVADPESVDVSSAFRPGKFFNVCSRPRFFGVFSELFNGILYPRPRFRWESLHVFSCFLVDEDLVTHLKFL